MTIREQTADGETVETVYPVKVTLTARPPRAKRPEKWTERVTLYVGTDADGVAQRGFRTTADIESLAALTEKQHETRAEFLAGLLSEWDRMPLGGRPRRTVHTIEHGWTGPEKPGRRSRSSLEGREEEIRALCLQRGADLTPDDLADALSTDPDKPVSPRTVMRWLRGKEGLERARRGILPGD